MDEEFAGKPAETQDEVLARLASEIRECVNRGAAGAITAGIKLIEAKRLLPHGEWLPWLRMHCELSERAAQYHMQLASAPNTKRISDLTVATALQVLRAEKKAKAAAGPTITLATP